MTCYRDDLTQARLSIADSDQKVGNTMQACACQVVEWRGHTLLCSTPTLATSCSHGAFPIRDRGIQACTTIFSRCMQ
jgi:hypothetical protein